MSYAKAYLICLITLLVLFVYSIGVEFAYELYKHKLIASLSWLALGFRFVQRASKTS